MEEKAQHTRSIWQQVHGPAFPILNEDVAADICVIGAGISGLSCAYRLLREGRTVVIIDRELQLGQRDSGLTSAHLSNALDDRYMNLRRLHGEMGARLAAESHTAAIDEIEKICTAETIQCDFRRIPGYLFLSPDRDQDYLNDEFKAAQAAGLQDLEILARVLTKAGHRILCEDIVVATNVPFNDRVIMQTKLAAYRTYAVAMEIPWGSFTPALVWDTADPYHYVRMARDETTLKDMLLVGGGDHRTGPAEMPGSDADDRATPPPPALRADHPELPLLP